MMSSYWANFASTGDPNGKGLPHWPSVSEAEGMTMELGDTNKPIPIAGNGAKEAFFRADHLSPRSCHSKEVSLGFLSRVLKKSCAVKTQAEPPAPQQQIKNLRRCGAGGSACQGLFSAPC
jgi:hypothetical protein